MIARTFHSFFFPRSVAVIGASRNPKKLGAVVFRNILSSGFRGTVYPVNPNAKRIGGHRCYATVRSLPRKADLVVIATPAATVAGILGECGKVGSRNCVVLSAGFSEGGEEGKDRERAVRHLVAQYNLKLLGPNCLGFAFGEHRLNASFGSAVAPGGSIVLLSQSGAMAAAMADWARDGGVEFRAIVSLGNKAGMDEVDLLTAFARDEKTKAFFLYLESMERGEEFLRVASRITKHKPIVVLKGGVSAIAQAASSTHTGALATSDRLVTAALEQSGCIRATSLESFFQLARLLSVSQPVGRRIAVLTNAGGPGIMAMEAVSRSGLVPAAVAAGNPLDVLGDAGAAQIRRGLRTIGESDADVVCVLVTRQIMTDATALAREIVRASRRDAKKLYCAVLIGGKPLDVARRFLAASAIPVFHYPEQAVAALASAFAVLQSAYEQPRGKGEVLRRTGLLLSPLATRLLRKEKIAVTPERFMVSRHDALLGARRLGYPVVLKRISVSLPHKKRKGGVWLNLATPHTLAKALRAGKRMFKDTRSGDGWLLQPFRAGKREYFLGARRDASFGPLLFVGRGGSGVEASADVAVLFPPFSVRRVLAALNRIPGNDRNVLARAANRLGAILLRYHNVRDVDVNPLFVARGKAEAGDVRIMAT